MGVPAVVHSFGGIVDLEDLAIGAEGGWREIVLQGRSLQGSQVRILSDIFWKPRINAVCTLDVHAREVLKVYSCASAYPSQFLPLALALFPEFGVRLSFFFRNGFI